MNVRLVTNVPTPVWLLKRVRLELCKVRPVKSSAPLAGWVSFRAASAPLRATAAALDVTRMKLGRSGVTIALLAGTYGITNAVLCFSFLTSMLD